MEPSLEQPTQLTTFKKYLPKVAIGAVGLIIVFVILAVVLASFNSARDRGFSSDSMLMNVPGAPSAYRGEYVNDESYEIGADQVGTWPAGMPVSPVGTDYIAGLEDYETTDYSVTARTRDFSGACQLVKDFKSDTAIDFQSLSEQTNRCTAVFFTSANDAEAVRQKLAIISGVEIARETRSVTRTRQQLQSRGDILREQLMSVETTLREAELQYADITEVARASNDATALARSIRDKLQIIDELNQRRITLTAQLQQLDQQASDLAERIDKVAFSVSITRSYPVTPDEFSRKWEQARENLKDQFTSTIINLTAYFGIFALLAIQFILYSLIIIVIARYLWKFVHFVWRR